MTMTDPVADFLTRIRNANMARHEQIAAPSSKLKAEIARILLEEGYIRDYVVEDAGPQKRIRLAMKYTRDGDRALVGIRRVSKPGMRVYAGKDELPRVLGGLGVAVLSTSQGVMSDREARRRGVGGEVLAYVW